MGSSGHGMRLHSAAQTDVGRIRENNEDSVRLWASDRYALAIVADGMGGAAAGEEASRIAVEAVEARLVIAEHRDPNFLETVTDAVILDKLQEAIRIGNTGILQRVNQQPELKGMGTTATLAFVRAGRALIAHVGDSRAYLFDHRAGRIQQLTADHSYVDLLIAAGQLTEQQAAEHPLRNVLYRALGQNEQVEIDIYNAVQLRPADWLILCSDGLTRHVRPEEIGSVAALTSTPDALCAALIAQANARGGEDNISVIAITVEGDGSAAASIDISDDSTVDLKKVRFSTNSDNLLHLPDDLVRRRPNDE